MKEIIQNRLWIGNANDARDVGRILALEITAVIDLAANEPPIAYPREIAYCHFPLHDGAGNHPAMLRAAIATTEMFIAAQLPLLVTCSAGMSRSPAIVAAALARVERILPEVALSRAALPGAHDVSPALWNEVIEVI
jgi:protein-tyrosine phosphatase